MVVTPKIDERRKVDYIGIRTKTTMQELPTVIPQMHDKVYAWLDKQNIEPSGPPFVRYFDVSEMDRKIDVEMGWPVANPLEGDGIISANTIPAGRYATVLHIGAYANLVSATAKLLAWAAEKDIQWKMDGHAWGARVEIYITDPADEPNPEKWETELAILIAE